MTALILILAAFFSGSLPFALWIGRWALGKDIRDYGDGNPGTFNVARAGGGKWVVLAFALDFLKGAIPVALANFVFHFDVAALTAVAIAAPLGHAFSPFLRFKGGKAVATVAGVWCGLTIWQGPTVGGIFLGFWFAFINESGWAVILMSLCVLAYFALTHLMPLLLAVWIGHFALFVWKHRAELVKPPTLRRWVLSWRS
jgi:glycerol-3-phosphate acyltransferase PlsY